MDQRQQRQGGGDEDAASSASSSAEYLDQESEQQEQENYFENLSPLEESAEDENYTKKVDEYLQMLQEACETLSLIDGGYRCKLEAYVKKRKEESELYRQVFAQASPTLGGGDGDLSKVHQRTAERRWRATTKVNGPAWKRALERNPPTKLKGLSLREQSIVSKNYQDRALWGKIMSGPSPEEHSAF
jgi:hypothetical protein